MDNRKILQKDISVGIQMPFSGRKSYSSSISSNTTCGILGAFFFLPASIIQKMNKITANFIWGGQVEKRKYTCLSYLTSLC